MYENVKVVGDVRKALCVMCWMPARRRSMKHIHVEFHSVTGHDHGDICEEICESCVSGLDADQVGSILAETYGPRCPCRILRN